MLEKVSSALNTHNIPQPLHKLQLFQNITNPPLKKTIRLPYLKSNLCWYAPFKVTPLLHLFIEISNNIS